MIFEFKAPINNLKPSNLNYGGKPYINLAYSTENQYINQQPESYATVLKYIKKSPECLAIFNAIASDIVSDGYILIPFKKQGKKTNIEKAQEFIKENAFKAQFKAGITDWLMLCNAGWWKGISKSELKEFAESKKIELKEEFYDEFAENRKFQHIPWTTMYILHDETDITAYKQVVGSSGQIVNQYGREIQGKRTSMGARERLW